jgi:hypothetical protein
MLFYTYFGHFKTFSPIFPNKIPPRYCFDTVDQLATTIRKNIDGGSGSGSGTGSVNNSGSGVDTGSVSNSGSGGGSFRDRIDMTQQQDEFNRYVCFF